MDITALNMILEDAGCDNKTVKRFMSYVDSNNHSEQIRVLNCHRCHLLTALHEDQKKIDCLDYLIHDIKQCKKK